MNTLGFTSTYYTLWQVSEPYQYWVDARHFEMRQDCNYLQNLSMNKYAAIAKIAQMGEYVIDLQMRGSHTFSRTLSAGNTYEVYEFSFGSCAGMDIRVCENVWQLQRAMESEHNIRTRAIAKRRLIDLGELVRYTWFESSLNDTEIGASHTKRLYTNASHIASIEAAKNAPVSAHYFAQGEKVEIEVKEIGYFSFETPYGRTSVCTYKTPDNRMFKYIGSTPPDVSKDEFVKVKATIKHDNYNGTDETKLQRVKVLQAA